MAELPWRGPGDGRPDLPLPPGKVPVRRNGSWRKRWSYLGAFSDELLVCAARVQVGPVGQTFWAVWDRERRRLHERTRMTPPLIARGEVWTELAEGEHTGRIDWAPEKGGTLVRIEAAARGAETEPVRAFLRAGEGRVGGGRMPDRRRRQLRVDAKAGGRRRLRRADRRAADPLRGARDRGRVLRLSPAPHRLGLVGRSRHDDRRQGGGLEPGQRRQRPAAALRAGDLGRRRAQRARPGQLRGARGDRVRRRAARVHRRGRAEPGRRASPGCATPTASRSAPSPGRFRAGSLWPRASA